MRLRLPLRRDSLAALLLLAGAAAADDRLPERLRAFEEARKFLLEPGGQARVNPAFEALLATGDVRAVAALADSILETIVAERGIVEAGRKAQREFAELTARAAALEADLKRLELKEKAGDRAVGPAIERCAAERARCLGRGEEIIKTFERMERTILFLRDLRDRLAKGCTALLKDRKGEEAKRGIEGIRRSLDPADREQGLLLVTVLAASGAESVEDQLLEILSAPKADDAVRLRAQYAIANHLTRRGAETLLRLWEKQPHGEPARHVLSLAAKKRLETIEDARAWVASLP